MKTCVPIVSLPEARIHGETLIDRGFTSEVFTWGRDRVLKLCFAWRPAADVQREFAVARTVHAAGIPAAAAFEMVEIAGRHGIVFECVRGPSLVRKVEMRPWTLFAAARQLAELHARLHAFPPPADLPSQRRQLERWIDDAADFSATQKEAARQQVARLPANEECVCHGDFHPGNILLTARGPVLIDWSRGTRGYALADVARTSVLFERATPPPGTSLRIRLLLKLSRKLLHAAYLKRYFELRPASFEELERWRVPQRMAGFSALIRAANPSLG